MNWSDFLVLRSSILQAQSEYIVRADALGKQLAFERAGEVHAFLQSILRKIAEEIGSFVPQSHIDQLMGHLNEYWIAAQKMSRFEANAANAPQIRVDLERQLLGAYDAAFPLLMQLVAASESREDLAARLREQSQASIERVAKEFAEFKLVSGEALDAASREYKSSLEAKTAELNALTSEIAAKISDLDSLMTEARKAVAQEETARQSEYFARAATDYEDRAKTWLRVSIGGFVLLVGLGVGALLLAMYGFYETMSNASVAQITISKVVLIGILAYGTVIASRNYFANRHNDAVNRHRANAISSYGSLVQATNTPEHRDIVLTHAASAVFSPQDTAFVKQAPSAADVPTTTIINSIAKGPVA